MKAGFSCLPATDASQARDVPDLTQESCLCTQSAGGSMLLLGQVGYHDILILFFADTPIDPSTN